jgi:hypothetical protein
MRGQSNQAQLLYGPRSALKHDSLQERLCGKENKLQEEVLEMLNNPDEERLEEVRRDIAYLTLARLSENPSGAVDAFRWVTAEEVFQALDEKYKPLFADADQVRKSWVDNNYHINQPSSHYDDNKGMVYCLPRDHTGSSKWTQMKLSNRYGILSKHTP